MSTSVLPQLNKENPTATSSRRTKNIVDSSGKKIGPGLNKPISLQATFGSTGGLSLTTPKRALGDVGNTLVQQRAAPVPGKKGFASETRRRSPVDSNSEAAVKKKPDISKSIRDVENNLPEPELLPVIPDTEDDFEDIFPSSERLQPQDVHHLVNFWENCRKPRLVDVPRSAAPLLLPPLDSCLMWETRPLPAFTMEPDLDEEVFIPPPWE